MSDSSSATDSGINSKQLQNDKIGTMIIIFVLTLTSQFLPWIIEYSTKRSKFFQKNAMYILAVFDILASLSTGVILGACFCHLFPDAEDQWDTYFSSYTDNGQNPPGIGSRGTGYPFTHFIMIAIFLVLIAVNEVFSKRGLQGHDHGSEKVTASADAEGHGHSHGIVESLFLNTAQKDREEAKSKPAASEGKCPCPEGECPCPDDTETGEHLCACPPPVDADLEPPSSINLSKVVATEGNKKPKTSALQAYVFFMSLALHAFIEGLSIGSEQYLNATFWSLFIAIVGHKVLDGLALGIPFYNSTLPFAHVVICFIISALMGPLGIMTGMIITADEALSVSSNALAIAIMLSMACGSFLYISCVEMIPTLFRSSHLVKTKLGLLFLGFGLMAVIAIFF